MKAVTYSQYGPPGVLKMSEVSKPEPKDHEILVKVYASSVTAATILMRKGAHPSSKLFSFAIRLTAGLKKPKKPILGYEVAGVVEKVGKNVKRFKIGDEVFGTTTGLANGSYAEYVCLPEQWKSGVVALKPGNVNFEQAAVIPVAGMTALHFFNKVDTFVNKKVLVYGASGSVGSCAVQLAKTFGADVTGVCSQKNFEMVKSLGADVLIDYTKEDFTATDSEYDIIFDAVGKIKKSSCKNVLKNDGVYFTVNSPTAEKTESLLKLKELVEEGRLMPYIDKIYPLENIVEAHTHADTGRKKGNIAIQVHTVNEV